MTLDIGIEKKICMFHSEVAAYKFDVCVPTNSVSAQIAEKMVDKFGGYRKGVVGPPGPQGPPGESLNAMIPYHSLATLKIVHIIFCNGDRSISKEDQ